MPSAFYIVIGEYCFYNHDMPSAFILDDYCCNYYIPSVFILDDYYCNHDMPSVLILV